VPGVNIPLRSRLGDDRVRMMRDGAARRGGWKENLQWYPRSQ
jgi:hypothetical protein